MLPSPNFHTALPIGDPGKMMRVLMSPLAPRWIQAMMAPLKPTL